jgi:hypothetical protein
MIGFALPITGSPDHRITRFSISVHLRKSAADLLLWPIRFSAPPLAQLPLLALPAESLPPP